MLAVLALAAAVAGGNLAVTAAPGHPRSGQRVEVRSTGQVGDTGGMFYLYRNLGPRCGTSARDEQRLGRKARPLRVRMPIHDSFDFTTRYRAGRAGTREWVCGYLYAITCDAAGNNCAPATGLPPDSGFSRALVRVRRSPA